LNPPLEPILKFGASASQVEHLDLATAIKVSQAVSSEFVPEKLIDTIMRTAIEQAGAERGLLIRPRGPEQRLEAEATTSGDSVSVQLRDEQAGAAALPESVLHYVLRTGESVILDDAAAQSAFAEDPYIRERQTRSILCLPLIIQGQLNGVVYLENNLTHGAFAPDRTAILKLLASQAAIALENATLSQALRESEQRFRDYAETASDWYWETDADHKVTRMKDYEQLRALGRLPLTSRIGLARWDFAEDLESQPEKWELHRSMLEARQPFRDFVYPAVRFDGSLTYVKVSGKPYFDADVDRRMEPIGARPALVGLHHIAAEHDDRRAIAPSVVHRHRGVLQTDRAVTRHGERPAFDLGVALRHMDRDVLVHAGDDFGLVVAVIDDGFMQAAIARRAVDRDILDAKRVEHVSHKVAAAGSLIDRVGRRRHGLSCNLPGAGKRSYRLLRLDGRHGVRRSGRRDRSSGADEARAFEEIATARLRRTAVRGHLAPHTFSAICVSSRSAIIALRLAAGQMPERHSTEK